MNTPKTAAQYLTSFANSDMSIARKDGALTICQTKLGNLFLSYDSESKTYTLTKQGPLRQTVAKGKAGIVRAAIVDAYDVKVEAA